NGLHHLLTEVVTISYCHPGGPITPIASLRPNQTGNSYSTVLGGLLGLQQRFQQSELAQKLAALQAAATYGTEAIPLLRQGLKDADLSVRSHLCRIRILCILWR
ncbi:hypothetical protein H6F90_01200, partial [Trichocoleus sp. FACHB-591]|uniref:hypothetical protein n=1 Tax=Trichocoleus sp. FACHB-591 TaxID=2692872 RepID=UPI001683A2F1